MAIANIKAILRSDISVVWEIVTSLDNYAWRSDLSKIEILERNKKFIEHTKDGYATIFTITKFEPPYQYEFEMENENMKGYWVGIFGKTQNGGTMIDFTEEVKPKKFILKLFVKGYLRKQQKQYVEDLRKALGE